MERKKLKCRWCDHAVPMWSTSKKARKPVPGWKQLRSHIKEHHRKVAQMLFVDPRTVYEPTRTPQLCE